MESPILPKDEHRVAAEDRIAGNGRRGGIVWFTGLSGAGKSTLAMKLERALFLEDYHFYVLDGDNIGQRPSADIGFSPNRRLSTGY